jgi:hypothetical protein
MTGNVLSHGGMGCCPDAAAAMHSMSANPLHACRDKIYANEDLAVLVIFLVMDTMF